MRQTLYAICRLPYNCRKITLMHKLNIAEYPEITDGVQTSDHEGLSDEFLVANCKFYDPDKLYRDGKVKKLGKQ